MHKLRAKWNNGATTTSSALNYNNPAPPDFQRACHIVVDKFGSIYQRGDQLVEPIVGIYAIVALGFGIAHQSIASVIFALSSIALFAVLCRQRSGAFSVRLLAGAILQCLLITIESQLHGFRGLGVMCAMAMTCLIIYEDPTCFWSCIPFVAIHATLVYTETHSLLHSLSWLISGLIEIALCAAIAKLLRDRTIRHMADLEEISHTKDELEKQLLKLNEETERVNYSEQRFKLVVDSSNDGVFDYDLIANTMYKSPRFLEMLGLAGEPCDGDPSNWIDSVHPEDKERILDTFQRFVSGELKIYSVTTRILNSDKVYRWWQVRSMAIRDPETGIAHRLVGSATDITAEKTAEYELRESADSYKTLFESVPLPMWLYEPETLKFVAVNPAAIEQYGYSREEFLSMDLTQIRPPEDVPRLMRRLELVRSGEASLNEVWRHVKKDGTVISVMVHSSESRLHTGVVVRAVMATDVTEQFAAQNALRESEQKFRELFENATQGIFQSTVDGGYMKVNPALAKIYGFDSPDSMIAAISDISTDLYVLPNRRAEFIKSVLKNDFVQNFESEIRRRDGSVIWISESARVVRNLKGEVEYFEGFVENITELKLVEIEREKRLAEAIEQADACPLTGLLNHRAFHKRLEEEADRALRNNQTLAVAVLDMDNFKFFNDAYGHAAGDAVLIKVAENLRACCRNYDVLARFGGDEFAVLLPNATPEFTASFAERVHVVMEDSGFSPPGYNAVIPITITIGTAIFPTEAATRLEAVELADSRLRRAKTGAVEDGPNELLRSSLNRSYAGFSVLDALVTAVDNKDRYTRRHSEDVVTYCRMIGHEMCLNSDAMETLELAALLHDVGKIGVPDSILRKPGELTDDEMEAVKQHPQMGAMIVSAVPGFASILDCVRHHHERWDGRGYPGGLTGHETPLFARIMAVADAFSAMTTTRPYRKGMEPERAISILLAGRGTQWDPICIDAFVAHWKKLHIVHEAEPELVAG